MTTYPMRSFQVKVIRLTKLDTCGAVVHGSTSTVTNKGLTKVTMTPQYENPTDYLVRNANDELEVNEQGLPLLRWYEVVIDFIRVDPYVITTALGYPLVLDDNANVVGWRAEEGDTAVFALEAWTALAGETCSAGVRPYGYRLLPYIINGQVNGDIVLENNVVTLSIKAHTHNNSPWGTGPYNVRLNGSSTPSPLATAIGALQHYHTERVLVAPPAAVDGAQNLP